MDIQQAQAPIKRDKVVSILEKSSVASELANHMAEDAVIAGILHEPEHYLSLADDIQSTDFTQRFNTAVWYAFEECTASNTAIDLVTVSDVVARYTDYVGCDRKQTLARLGVLMGSTPAAANILDHAKLVRESAQRIRMYDASLEIMSMTRNKELTNEELVDKSDLLMSKASEVHQSLAHHVQARAKQFVQSLKDAEQRTSGVMTGFHEIDAHNVNGFLPRRVTVFAGFSGSGKTTWSLSMLRNICAAGKRVLLFTIEMNAEDIMAELTSMESGVYRSKMRGGSMTPTDWNRVAHALNTIAGWQLEIIDSDTLPRSSPSAIRRHIRKAQLAGQVDLVIVDGLWITESDDAFDTSKGWEIIQKNIGKFVKLAKTLHIPIFLLHQYSDDYKNADKPTLDMLMGGQKVHNDPHTVFGLWRKHDDTKTLVYHLKERGGSTRKQPFAFFYNTEFNCYETFEETEDHQNVEF